MFSPKSMSNLGRLTKHLNFNKYFLSKTTLSMYLLWEKENKHSYSYSYSFKSMLCAPNDCLTADKV
jgi:hypothetical protein